MNGLDDVIRAAVTLLLAGGASAGIAAARKSNAAAADDLQKSIREVQKPHEFLNSIGGGDGPDAD